MKLYQRIEKIFFRFFKKGIDFVENIRPQGTSNLLIDVGRVDIDRALELTQSSRDGLEIGEAKNRLEKYGKNEIAQEKPPVWWLQLIRAFVNPFNAIIILLAIVSFFTDVFIASSGEKTWVKIILLSVMVLVSGLLRFWQEFRSQRAAEKLKALVQNKALVIRQGWNNGREIPLIEIVPGDIVSLSAGDIIPADLRLISTDEFFVSQSALTGESMPIEKYAELEQKAEINNPLEVNTLCFMGTSVVSGIAMGVVVATGGKTYFGSLAKKITKDREITSFDKGLNKVSWLLIRFMLVMVPIVFFINWYTKADWQIAFFFALAVAVGLTPEMLPLVVTANLAKGAVKMASKKVIVKKLNAIQNFGAMDILCTDKTGTITENRIVLIRYIDARGEESERVLNLAYLNSYFQTGLKNLMDQAVVEKKEKLSSIREDSLYSKIDEIPFDFTRRRMSVVVEKESQRLLICKGAVEEVMEVCTEFEDRETNKAVTEKVRQEAARLTKELNKEGLRILAVAYKSLPKEDRPYEPKDEHNLILIGYIGFLDPPKSSAKDALKLLKEHGIQVKVITGDNEIVTAKICNDVQLDKGRTLLGNEIEKMEDNELLGLVEETTIFAKIDPIQKARIVEALKKKGHTVGYLGDGVNDAAAMRAADVGVSVDSGVDIAKESADIILLENDLLVLGEGVVEGRTVFGNIMKYIKMTTSSNFGNVLSVLVASAFLPFLPMLPIHLLIQNLLYDFSQLSIPWDRMDKEFLIKPRKWSAANIGHFMLFIGPVSSLFDIATYLFLWFVFGATTVAQQSFFQSGWFIEGLLSQTLIIHMIRTEKIPFIESRATTPVILLTTAIMAIGTVFPFTSFGKSVGMQALPLTYFPWLLITLVGYVFLVQVVKKFYIKKFNSWLA